ncbi:1-aminocyclopropane-1-carboxylate synthase-like protein 1 isoform X2 [Hyla sarda]|uniref:1-aminocyclopropane-1-carboxylate synthase-like protein 1 isoform X2 n=1 Tax=Hyla sarda TaxID=327740 RepID=UPI0024C2DBDF|nr:1-aminocyclopropane-1-carboxylate synthase-like protein 1 isoform X2 [Hyla sarda]
MEQGCREGFLNLGVAENKLCVDLMKERLTRPDMSDLEPSLLGYNIPIGIKSLREEAAHFLTDYCHSPHPLNPDHIVVMNGCSSILCALSAVICDPEDGFLTPTPYYSRIAIDTGLQPVYVPLDSQVTGGHNLPFSLTMQKLEEGMEKGKQQGIRIKALILTNPQNPLGNVYSPHLLKECLEFANRFYGYKTALWTTRLKGPSIFLRSYRDNTAPWTMEFKGFFLLPQVLRIQDSFVDNAFQRTLPSSSGPTDTRQLHGQRVQRALSSFSGPTDTRQLLGQCVSKNSSFFLRSYRYKTASWTMCFKGFFLLPQVLRIQDSFVDNAFQRTFPSS